MPVWGLMLIVLTVIVVIIIVLIVVEYLLRKGNKNLIEKYNYINKNWDKSEKTLEKNVSVKKNNDSKINQLENLIKESDKKSTIQNNQTSQKEINDQKKLLIDNKILKKDVDNYELYVKTLNEFINSINLDFKLIKKLQSQIFKNFSINPKFKKYLTNEFLITLAKKQKIEYITNELTNKEIIELFKEFHSLIFIKKNSEKFLNAKDDDGKINQIISSWNFGTKHWLKLMNVETLRLILKDVKLEDNNYNKTNLINKLNDYFNSESEINK